MLPREVDTAHARLGLHFFGLRRFLGHIGRRLGIDGEEQRAVAQHLVGTVVGTCQPSSDTEVREVLGFVQSLHLFVVMIDGFESTCVGLQAETVVVDGDIVEGVTCGVVQAGAIQRLIRRIGVSRVVAAPVFHALQQTVVALPEHVIALVPRHETSLCYVAQRQSAVYVVAPHFAHLSTRFYTATVHCAPVFGVHHQVIAFLIHRLVIQQHTACQHGQSAWCVPRRV